MKRNEALPGKYLKKADFPNPVLCQVAQVVMEEVDDNGAKKRKPVMYIMGPSDPKVDVTRGIILNTTNWEIISEIRGEHPDKTDTADWSGMQIVVFNDPNVRFGNERGGIRFRAPRTAAGAAPPPPPPPADDEIPF